jgi:hypothetical protein
MRTIKAQMPTARFIHMIRDGRDVALSLCTEKFIRPFRWDKDKSLLIAALHWRWKVALGLRESDAIGSDYAELRFESLINHPQQVLSGISQFVGCELDYQQIRQGAVGAVKNTNSTFKSGGQTLAANPVGRWRTLLGRDQIASLESCIGDLLEQLGYELRQPSDAAAERFRWIKTAYPFLFSAKNWLKQHTKAGLLTSIDRMQAA